MGILWSIVSVSLYKFLSCIASFNIYLFKYSHLYTLYLYLYLTNCSIMNYIYRMYVLYTYMNKIPFYWSIILMFVIS